VPDLPACYEADVGEMTAAGLAVLARARTLLAERRNDDPVAVVDGLAQEIADDHTEEA